MITLAQIDDKHVEALRAWLADPKLTEYFRRFPPSTAWLSAPALKQAMGISWIIESDGAPVGLVNISAVDTQARRAEFGVLVCADVGDSKRMRIARPALMLLGDYLFNHEGLNKAYCYVLPHREDLRYLLTSAKFVEEGRMREHCFFNGKFHDELVFSLTRADFATLPRNP